MSTTLGSRSDGFAALAAWACASCGTLAYVAFGPHAWARQPVENATLAAEWTAIGQGVFLAAALPCWAATDRVTRLTIFIGAPAFVLLAATLGPTRTGAAIGLALQVAALAVTLSTIWAVVLRAGPVRRTFWLALLAWTLGLPAIGWIGADYGSGAGWALHFSLPMLMSRNLLPQPL